MRAFLSTLTFDPLGAVVIDCLPTTTLGESRRRMNRIATLDGGAVFNDFGFAEADRSIELRWRPRSATHEEAVDRLVQLYAQIRLATTAGCWLVAPETYTPGATESRLSLLAVTKLA